MPSKLLLADDSVTIQRVIELTFADEDMQVEVVGDGKQAIDRIQADCPDIVLADIGMPERDGYEVAAFIKNTPRFAHVPVVLLTGAFEPVDETRARAVGCDAVLVKPFEPQMVINRVKELLSTHQLPQVPATTRRDAHAAPRPASGEPDTRGDAVEDYFDRLDAAFARLASTPRAPALASEKLGSAIDERNQHAHGKLPTSDARVIDSETLGDSTPVRQPQLANAFAALFAAEQGQPLPPEFAQSVVVSDETIEEVVRRVLSRMADDSMRALVLETAERLVREEIDRIKRGG